MSDYLWDRSGPVDPDVEALERQLKPLAFDPHTHPLEISADSPAARAALTTAPRRAVRQLRPLRIVFGTLAAAAVLAVGLNVWHNWRLDWQPNRAWTINSGGVLAMGAPLRVGSSTATIDIARLGELAAAPGTELELTSTTRTRHRVAMTRGSINVRVWAPPGRVAVQTPAGDVVDLGCIFALSVDDAGVAHLSVRAGWVELENAFGSRAVPAGASASMSADREPQVPVYDDAREVFKTAVRALEAAPGHADADALRIVTTEARAKDALTLLLLADVDGMPAPARRDMLNALATFHAAPSADAISRILNGDRNLLWTWYATLPLPPMKNWWANWRDVFPRSFGPSR